MIIAKTNSEIIIGTILSYIEYRMIRSFAFLIKTDSEKAVGSSHASKTGIFSPLITA